MTLATLLAETLAEHRKWRLDDSSPLVTRWLCSCGQAFPLVTSRTETSHDIHAAAELARTVAAWIEADEQVEVVEQAVAGEFYAMQGGDPAWSEAPKANEGDRSVACTALAALARTAGGDR